MRYNTGVKKVHVLQFLALLTAVGCMYWILSLTESVRGNEAALALVEQYGHFGIFLAALVGGFNVFVPVPAAVLTPVFMEAGFSLYVIIFILTLGTTVADSIGYALGVIGRHATAKAPPHWVQDIEQWVGERPTLVVPTVFLYAAFIPFPNEILLLPLGLAGFRYRTLILPLIGGSLLNQTMLATGFNGIFSIFF